MIQNMKLYDSYRGLLAIIVMFGHLCDAFLFPYIGIDGWLPGLVNYSSTWAVNIFFLLSGYLITFSIFLNISKNGYFKWSDFLIARVARIYPPLIASIGVSAFLYWMIASFNLHGLQSFRLPSDLYVLRESFTFPFNEIDDSLLMRGGLGSINGPLWSLYIEVKIYLIAMFLAIFLKGKSPLAVKGVALIAMGYLVVVLRTSLVFLAIWLMGSVFCIISMGKFRLGRGAAVWFYSLAFCISLYLAIASPVSFLQEQYTTIYGFAATISLSALISGAIFAGEFGAGLLYFFSPAAKYSYTLYIVHFPLVLFAFSLFHEAISRNFSYPKLLAVSLFVFGAILGIAYAMSLFFEDKKRFEEYIKLLLPAKDPR